jgi:hypothetical protein
MPEPLTPRRFRWILGILLGCILIDILLVAGWAHRQPDRQIYTGTVIAIIELRDQFHFTFPLHGNWYCLPSQPRDNFRRLIVRQDHNYYLVNRGLYAAPVGIGQTVRFLRLGAGFVLIPSDLNDLPKEIPYAPAEKDKENTA